MPIRNRDTLKKIFSEGQRPTEADFENLIDSTVNILDDGFSKNTRMGIKLAPLSDKEGTVMTFLQEASSELIRWEIAVISHKDLRFSRRSGDNIPEPLLIFKNNGDIEAGAEGKEIRLAGTVKTAARKGAYIEKVVLADGNWHDVTSFEESQGICAFEVVAACGKRTTGKHAVIVATATHCYGSKARIKKVSSHYGSFMNRLRLRWVRKDNKCKLQVRTYFTFGDGVKIHCNIMRLWDDPLMEKH